MLFTYDLTDIFRDPKFDWDDAKVQLLSKRSRSTSRQRDVINYDEKSNAHNVEIDLAGAKKENIKLKIEENKLVVDAVLKDDEKYSKTYVIDTDPNNKHDLEQIIASYVDGILRIIVPFKQKKTDSLSREIMIS